MSNEGAEKSNIFSAPSFDIKPIQGYHKDWRQRRSRIGYLVIMNVVRIMSETMRGDSVQTGRFSIHLHTYLCESFISLALLAFENAMLVAKKSGDGIVESGYIGLMR
jgi:prolipoprotein diacylglyceryltransferase